MFLFALTRVGKYRHQRRHLTAANNNNDDGEHVIDDMELIIMQVEEMEVRRFSYKVTIKEMTLQVYGVQMRTTMMIMSLRKMLVMNKIL